MATIYFENGVIKGTYTYDGSLWVRLKNKQSIKYLKQWYKRKNTCNIVLIWLDKIWLMVDCKPFHKSIEKFGNGKTLTFTFTHDRGVVLKKNGEYDSVPWIKEARKELKKVLKDKREKRNEQKRTKEIEKKAKQEI